jgi:CCR4-NOT transcription complex subunit 1
MRNVVLSAYPRTLKLPDPFNERLRLDKLKDMDVAPPVLEASRECFTGTSISRAAVDHFMQKKKADAASNEFLSELVSKLRDPTTGRYNVPLMNDLIYYVGIVQAEARVAAVTAATNKAAPAPAFNVAETPAYELVSYLAAKLNNEGRFMLVTACANQLRFPNSHTQLFALILITLISQAPDGVDAAEHEHIQEIICRVLLERIVVTRPQPWGLLVTIFEIIKNPRYDLQSKMFYRYSPQVQKFFDNISQKLNGTQRSEQPPQQQPGATAAPQQAAGPPPQPQLPRHPGQLSR